ncbi:HD domain-containing protein [Staphylococcus felis]|uniref:bis(5'-nucleosyl)-tetraphosphatase (symmetrical) n=1 Tax=Staphylococcus felis TaxID=46127 RepID=A0A2K3ZAE3_9STAP|nr:bis(5'-nucleosyl)-tetraphosphatase (symmetrical) YqeK [Staphylococcus felis]AVP37194.1 HD domain-containing protein [Staphylococcus felis]PNZ34434.1 HAD family hydrolase [Staphylococcus felis]QQB02859.1 bis(5'-nucleosyl)-tetraphosphatase (symmetrical) YqeK [Staphylococcus felis]REH76128.1 HD domain-containing protein [Staphylococcus felis]REH81665.1 HD domain-containing protein [Staphylococcus felis]
MDKAFAIELVEQKLPQKRFDHSIRVAETAVKLSKIYEGDAQKAELAGILHDFCKYDDLSSLYQKVTEYELDSNLLSYGTEILHGPVCAAIMEHQYHISDKEILLAIANHTTGRKNMTKTEKLVFIADYIEPGRKTPGVDEIRSFVYSGKGLDRTIYEISKRTVMYLVSKDVTVYQRTIDCLNYYNLNESK